MTRYRTAFMLEMRPRANATEAVKVVSRMVPPHDAMVVVIRSTVSAR